MQSLKTPYQIREMTAAAHHLRQFLAGLSSMIVPGGCGLDIERAAGTFCREHGFRPLLKGYRGFPALVCVNRNECAAHGVPNALPWLKGDVVTIDFAVERAGFCSDMAWTYLLEDATDQHKRLLAVAWQASLLAAKASIGGTAAMAQAVRELANQNGCAVLPQFAGHGIGRQMHEPPRLPYLTRAKAGLPPNSDLEIGTVFTVEPILAMPAEPGGPMNTQIQQRATGYFLPRGMISAQFEFMVAMEATGPRLLGLSEQTPPETPRYNNHFELLSQSLPAPRLVDQS